MSGSIVWMAPGMIKTHAGDPEAFAHHRCQELRALNAAHRGEYGFPIHLVFDDGHRWPTPEDPIPPGEYPLRPGAYAWRMDSGVPVVFCPWCGIRIPTPRRITTITSALKARST